MAVAGKNSEDPRNVEAALNYCGADGGRDRRIMTIRDARGRADLSLDREGFVLAERPTAVVDFYNADEVREIYYPEVAKLLMDITGALRAQVFEHDVRCDALAQRDKKVRTPVRMIHDDYTAKSSPERIRLYLPDEAEALISKHYAIINVWRAIRGPVEATPLAVCDASSVKPEDLLPTEEGVKHEVYQLRFERRHRWYYFSQMRREEALILKCFDSDQNVVGRCTAHSAFDDPHTPSDAAPRESIEARAFVFYG